MKSDVGCVNTLAITFYTHFLTYISNQIGQGITLSVLSQKSGIKVECCTTREIQSDLHVLFYPKRHGDSESGGDRPLKVCRRPLKVIRGHLGTILKKKIESNFIFSVILLI